MAQNKPGAYSFDEFSAFCAEHARMHGDDFKGALAVYFKNHPDHAEPFQVHFAQNRAAYVSLSQRLRGIVSPQRPTPCTDDTISWKDRMHQDEDRNFGRE